MDYEITLPVAPVVWFSISREGKRWMEAAGWVVKREVEAVVLHGAVVTVVEVVMMLDGAAVEDTMEKEQMGIRTKNN